MSLNIMENNWYIVTVTLPLTVGHNTEIYHRNSRIGPSIGRIYKCFLVSRTGGYYFVSMNGEERFSLINTDVDVFAPPLYSFMREATNEEILGNEYGLL